MLRRFSALLVVALAAAVSLYSQGNLLINGAGATFPYPVYSKWFDEYHKLTVTFRLTISPSAPARASSKSPKALSISALLTAR